MIRYKMPDGYVSAARHSRVPLATQGLRCDPRLAVAQFGLDAREFFRDHLALRLEGDCVLCGLESLEAREDEIASLYRRPQARFCAGASRWIKRFDAICVGPVQFAVPTSTTTVPAGGLTR